MHSAMNGRKLADGLDDAFDQLARASAEIVDGHGERIASEAFGLFESSRDRSERVSG